MNPLLYSWVEMLPFEHMIRKKDVASAGARWKIERAAYRHAEPKDRVGLLLASGGDKERWLRTLATWASQTWVNTSWSIVSNGTESVNEPWADERKALGLREPDSCGPSLDRARFDALGYAAVVPAKAGDLFHPSLAGIVASRIRRGASAVAWDWLEGEESSMSLHATSRRRAPAVDPLAESMVDRRGRAFAIIGSRWSGHPVTDAWSNRIMAASHIGWALHSEPLALYTDTSLCASLAGTDWSSLWGTSFETGLNGEPFPSAACRRISVVLMYRDHAELTLAAIASILTQQIPGELELVLVDNQSSSASRQSIQRGLSDLPRNVQLKKILYDDDFNHSRQCNLAVAEATGDVVIFLNNDAELLVPDALDKLSRWALVPGVATVGAQIVDKNGKGAGGGFKARALPGAEVNSPVEEAAGTLAEMSRTTVGNSFACAAIARSVFLELGGLDEIDFPVGFNDVDFCLRAVVAGWRHLNLADVKVMHAVGASRAPADEIAQKLLLRRRHPWVSVHALGEYEWQPLQKVSARMPSIVSLLQDDIKQNYL